MKENKIKLPSFNQLNIVLQQLGQSYLEKGLDVLRIQRHPLLKNLYTTYWDFSIICNTLCMDHQFISFGQLRTGRCLRCTAIVYMNWLIDLLKRYVDRLTPCKYIKFVPICLVNFNMTCKRAFWNEASTWHIMSHQGSKISLLLVPNYSFF